jgi:hypothetical protein
MIKHDWGLIYDKRLDFPCDFGGDGVPKHASTSKASENVYSTCVDIQYQYSSRTYLPPELSKKMVFANSQSTEVLSHLPRPLLWLVLLPSYRINRQLRISRNKFNYKFGQQNMKYMPQKSYHWIRIQKMFSIIFMIYILYFINQISSQTYFSKCVITH